MNWTTRNAFTKSFIPGGLYNHSQISKPLEQQQQQPQIIVNEIYEDKKIAVKENTSMHLSKKMVKNGKIDFKKIFPKRKTSKRSRERKIRQNRKLQKAILPKNALVVLNELKGVVISELIFSRNIVGDFTATVKVNDIPYEGRGSSKMKAKSIACENALRDYFVAKLIAKPINLKSIAPAAENSQISEDPQSDDSDSDVPMINLASFAIYKLFSEWEKEGFFVSGMQPQSQKEAKKFLISKQLPTNWRTLHPVTLLCMMRPGINFVDQSTFGDKLNELSRFGVIVDDKLFSATGSSKKIARRNLAIKVCNKLFGTMFITCDSITTLN